ncbi:putative leucine-rich repeat protein [Leishmania mexicana MHOM/GT/2001/U1103]|uniref:Leucine-rich repeat protein n=1 Tax=Leishmania mexicana (strain MHOM/GT/2001/U1103) TaxID=929439 RepID=E9ANU2_LEIMU|nr:putative leucine-rich repeat protein [Leishmania mexicana MHOM/GT/2001/U1103]CBZ24606.1 putative leucine-rich repeat protein [Leishmania mexicana MHOM/GT/2001/U1103]
MSTSQASLVAPRSSPLQCYAHVSSLDLTHNALTSIAGIDALRCLRSLRLAFNKLTSLAPLWASPYVAQLDVLDVSSNELTELLSTEDVHALKGHQIRIVTHPTQARSAAHGCPNGKWSVYKTMRLRVLYASDNRFCEVPSAIYTFTQLTDLRLSRNAIESVPDGFPVRACLPQLTRLDLSMNKLPAARVESVTARTEEVAESPHHRHRTLAASPSFTQVKGARRASAHRSHGSTDPSVGGHTAALSSAPSSALKTGDGASSEEAGSGAMHGAECSRDIQSRLPGGVKENGRAATEEDEGVSLINGSGQRRSSASAAKVADNAEPDESRGTLLQVKADAAVSPQPPTKTRHESASVIAFSPSTRKATASLPPTTPAISTISARKAQQQDAVQCVAENVYSIDLSRWAAVVRRRLEEAVRRSPDSNASGAPGATSTCSMHELLVSLSDTLGGNSSGVGAAALTRHRRRSVATARTIAALLQCLPSHSLFYSEEAQVRCPPLLLLTGISAAVAADESELLLYEVLALHIVHNCLCTAKSAPGGVSPPYAASTASSLTVNSSDVMSQQASTYESSSEPLLRAEAPAADRAISGELPPLRPGSPGSGRGGGTARQLNFAVPLQAVHVIACTDAAATPHSSASALWAYLTWRQRWEAAVSRRRFPNKSDYVCELGKQSADESAPHPLPSNTPSVTAEANGRGTPAAPHCATAMPLYPFTANPLVPRAWEGRALHEYRPGSYCAVPPAWELLYDLLLRPSTPEKTALKRLHVPAVPPLLAGVGSRMQHVRGIPVSLACVLLCAVDSSGYSGASTMCASPTSPVLRWPTQGTGDPAASGAGNGTSAITASHAPCESVIHRALQWRQHSQQLWSHVEREVSIVAAEQVTSCSMPLYSAEEVLQSQQAAVAALSSPDAYDTCLQCELFTQNGVSEGAPQTQFGSLASVKPLSQPRRSASSAAESCSTETCESEAATVTDRIMWCRESGGSSRPSVVVGADGGSSPAVAEDAVSGESDELSSVEAQDAADAAVRFNTASRWQCSDGNGSAEPLMARRECPGGSVRADECAPV